MEKTILYKKLFEEYKNDTSKLECMLSYLKKDEWFSTEYDFMDERELFYWTKKAAFYCESSILNSPLAIAIIISLIYLTATVIGILIYQKILRK